jgi:uroporphyrinogen-III decarboxylase
VTARAAELLSHTATHRNYVLSSGCDVPASVPLANLDAFYAAVKKA